MTANKYLKKQLKYSFKNISNKEYLFFKSFNLLKKAPSKTCSIILFDVLFFVIVFGLQNLFRYFARGIFVIENFPSILTLPSILTYLIFSSIYFLILIFVYTFFKYGIMSFISSLFENTKFSFNRLGQFYSLNIIIAGIFFAMMILLSFILESIKEQYAPFVFIFLATVYILFLYISINISHSLFYQGISLKETLKKTFKLTFTRIRIYRENVLVIILSTLLLGILFLGGGYLISQIAYKNYSLYLNSYQYFKQAIIIIFDLSLYFIILINRILFYYTIKKFNA